MNTFITALFILFVTVNVFYQEEYVKLPNAKTHNPSFIVNKNIIESDLLLKRLGSSEEEIQEKMNEISVLKEKQDSTHNGHYNLTAQGILFVDLNETSICKTQSKLNVFFGLDQQNEMYVDGYLLESKNYLIALSAITELEIVQLNTDNGLKNKVLNVWTLAKSERYTAKTNE